MRRITQSEASSDGIWPESSSRSKSNSENVPFIKIRNEDLYLKDILSSVDDSPDFHDPYSDLNLFLSQKIMYIMKEIGVSKKWCGKLQEELIEKITPDFQRKFPQYRLGVSALKKTWEKISHYSQQIRHQKEAINQDGKLNIHFFIRENLKQYTHLKNPYNLHPYHYAHQLAAKMSECIATIDGTRPKLDHLTKLIWSMQRNLLTDISPQNYKSPYDENDKIDKLVVKTILEISAKDAHLTQSELEHEVKEALNNLKDLPNFASLDRITSSVSALLAEKLYPSSPIHHSFPADQKKSVYNFIRRQILLYKGSVPSPLLSELVRRIKALYILASGLPKNLSEEDVQCAIRSVYPVVKEDRPDLNQSIYAFISAESVLMKNDQYCHSVEYVAETIFLAYKEAKCLPELNEKEIDLLEVLIWKTLNETEGLLENLPYLVGQRIDEEIANCLIDHPGQPFGALVSLSVRFFKRTKELANYKKWEDLDRKIHFWTMQSDMICRWIKIDTDGALFKLVHQKCLNTPDWAKQQNPQSFISEIGVGYLKTHPELAIYAPKLMLRILNLYKYVWYNLLSSPQESSYERFLKWHIMLLGSQFPDFKQERLFCMMEDVSKKLLPLIPFDPVQCTRLITLFKKENES